MKVTTGRSGDPSTVPAGESNAIGGRGVPEPVERSTEWCYDYGASRSVFTDERATLVVADAAHIRIDLDHSSYEWYGIWYDSTWKFPAYLWVAGTITSGAWSHAFSGKHTLQVRAGSFRLVPDFPVPGSGDYTVEYVYRQCGAHWYSTVDQIDRHHSGTVTLP